MQGFLIFLMNYKKTGIHTDKKRIIKGGKHADKKNRNGTKKKHLER